MHIVNVKEYPGGIEKAAAYIHDKWGSSENYQFYFDAIVHSSEPGRKLPKVIGKNRIRPVTRMGRLFST